MPTSNVVLQAAQQAPSGGNVQPQQYVVITDPDVKRAVGRGTRRLTTATRRRCPPASCPTRPHRHRGSRTTEASRHLADNMGQVPAMVLFLQPIIPWGSADAEGPLDIGRLDASVYPAVQNFCLAARSIGLGTALTTVVRVYTREVLDLLGVPVDRFEIAALVPVGYPQGKFGVAPPKARIGSDPLERLVEQTALAAHRVSDAVCLIDQVIS